MLRWYGSLPSYANTAVLELGEFDASAGDSARDRQAVRQGAGALFDLDSGRRYGTLGLYLFRDEESADGAGARVLMYGQAWTHAQAGLVVGYRRAFYHGDRRRLRETLVGLGARLDLGETPIWIWRATGADVYRLPRTGRLSRPRRRSWAVSACARAPSGVPAEGWAMVPVFAYRATIVGSWGIRRGGRSTGYVWEARDGSGEPVAERRVTGIVGEYRRCAGGYYRAEGRGPLGTGHFIWSAVALRLGLEARLRPWLSLRAGAISPRARHRRAAGLPGLRPARRLRSHARFRPASGRPRRRLPVQR